MSGTQSGAPDRAEPLLFELGSPGRSGIDLPTPAGCATRLGSAERSTGIGLPDLDEATVVRHYTRLSRLNHGIDTAFYPLGSCTMKHNPRLHEKLARLPGFADVHPLQPVSTVQGALTVIDELARWLRILTGLPAVAMWPAAGAHGELCGLMAIRAAHEAKGEARHRVLVPDSAHGTNPATAAFCGFEVEKVQEGADGRVDTASLEAALGPDVAAIMLTNPNTCGVFESDIQAMAEATHAAGAYFYCDGANFNALVGKVKPGDLGVDAMHINLHKTFSTPHGGGGPGAGPTVLSAALAPFAPLPWVLHEDGGQLRLLEQATGPAGASFGRLRAFHGQMGTFVRALAYCLSYGREGIRQVAEDAVLNANYLRSALADTLSPAYPGPCMHECLFDDSFLDGTGVTTLDFAKALIERGFHPPTVYFPLVVSGALLVEPTETESRTTLDSFIEAARDLAARAHGSDAGNFADAPGNAPRRRADETRAARSPVLRWKPPAAERG